MNYPLLSRYLGVFALVLGLAMIVPMLWGLYFQEFRAALAFFLTLLVSGAAGGGLWWLGRRAQGEMYQRETLGLVGLTWFVAATLGALPYVWCGSLEPVDALFESMSGFTTTGSTVYNPANPIDAQPKSLLFWRAFTQWLGGVGIVVLFIAVLPYLGAGGKQLFKSESTGLDPKGLRPRIQHSAAILYRIYFGFTVALTVLLVFAGMSFYDALCHTFTTVSTGGFSTQNASIAHFDNRIIELILIVFMVGCGINFALYYGLLQGNWRTLVNNAEWRAYMVILAVGTLLVAANLAGATGTLASGSPNLPAPRDTPSFGVWEALRHAAFQVTSIMTTTGFVTDEFNNWPYFSRAILVGLMLVGGCAGSTAGGLKVVRMVLAVKFVLRRVENTFRPKTVRQVRLQDEIVDDPALSTVCAFFILAHVWLAGGTLFMSVLGLPFESAFTSVMATLNNVGPGLELVSGFGDYSAIPAIGKAFLVLSMVVGRLEYFAICAMFVPAFWRPN